MSSDDIDTLPIKRGPAELADIKAEFRKRQWRRLLVLVPMVLLVVVGIGGAAPWVLYPVAAISIVASVFALFNWRCPACENLFGKQNVRGKCPHCGVELE